MAAKRRGARWPSGQERGSLNPEVPSSNPTNAVSNLGQVRLPHVALMSMNVCVYEDLHGKKWLYTYGATLKLKKKKKGLESRLSTAGLPIINDTKRTVIY